MGRVTDRPGVNGMARDVVLSDAMMGYPISLQIFRSKALAGYIAVNLCACNAAAFGD